LATATAEGDELQYHSAGLTDVGQRRKSNQDAFFVDDDLGLYVVADGMGGHAAGEIASQEAVDTVHGMVSRGHDALDRVAQGDTSEDSLRKAIRIVESAVQAATYMVFGLAQHDPEQQGMGTTVSVLAMCGDYGITAQVGDSRIYLIRGHAVEPLTEDHTLVAWQLKQGIITEAEAARSPHRNVITRAVGSREYVQVDTGFFEVQPPGRDRYGPQGRRGTIHPHGKLTRRPRQHHRGCRERPLVLVTPLTNPRQASTVSESRSRIRILLLRLFGLFRVWGLFGLCGCFRRACP